MIGLRVDRSRARKNAGLLDADDEIGQLEALLPERLETTRRTTGMRRHLPGRSSLGG